MLKKPITFGYLVTLRDKDNTLMYLNSKREWEYYNDDYIPYMFPDKEDARTFIKKYFEKNDDHSYEIYSMTVKPIKNEEIMEELDNM